MTGWQESLRFVFVDGTLLVVLFATVTLLVFLSQQYALGKSIQQKMAGAGLWRGASLAAVGGAVTPFCSCSTVPVLNGMLRSDLRLAACFSFLIASPVINEGVFVLLAGRSGLVSATAFVLSAAALCVLAGVLVERAGMNRYVKVTGASEVAPEGFLGHASSPVRPPFLFALRSAWRATRIELRQLFPYLALGVVIGGLIYGYVPQDTLLMLEANVPAAVLIPLAALVSLPLYVSPMAVVPIGFALLEKGLSPGVVVAFLIGAAGTSFPEMVMLGRLFRWPLVLTHILVVLTAAIVLGSVWQWMS